VVDQFRYVILYRLVFGPYEYLQEKKIRTKSGKQTSQDIIQRKFSPYSGQEKCTNLYKKNS